MANILNLPNLRPSLLLDFANSGRVDPRINFARAAAASRWNAAGLQESVAAGVPRIDHDPVTGKCLGLLVEEARTNSIVSSGDLSQSAWAKTRTTATAPDADGFCKVVEAAVNDSHLVSQTVTITAADRVVRLILKAGERTRAQVEFTGNTGNAGRRVWIDLVAGTVLSNTVIGSGGLTASSVSARLIGTGITELTIYIAPTTTTGSSANLVIALHDGAGVVYQGDGASGIYIKNVQLEGGGAPSSYIPTTTAAATRAAESPYIDVSPDWYNPAGGTLLVEAIAPNSIQSFARIASLERPGVNVLSIQRVQDTVSSTARGYFEGASIVAGAASFPPSVPVKVALAGAPGDFALSASGSIFTSSLGAFGVPTQLRLGTSISGLSHLNGHIQRVAYYPRRLTNAQLQRLTA